MPTQIAIGALRYFLLKFTRNSVIAFDFQEALSFEGETGPYVQYAAVRARNILRKLDERGEQLPDFSAELSAEALGRQLQSRGFLAGAAGGVESGCRPSSAPSTAGEPAHVAKYAFQLAQAFNNFYHQYPVMHEQESREEGVPAVDDRLSSGANWSARYRCWGFTVPRLHVRATLKLIETCPSTRLAQQRRCGSGDAAYRIFRLETLEEKEVANVSRLPFSTKFCSKICCVMKTAAR